MQRRPLNDMRRGGPPLRDGPGRNAPPPIRVDRDKTCPFLVRVFVKTGTHHDDFEFSPNRMPVQDEYELYLWKDATPREVITLLKDVSPLLRVKGPARFSLRHVFFEPNRQQFLSRDWASISNKDPAPDSIITNERTLQSSRFVIGDMIDVSFQPPLSQQPPPPPSSGPNGGMPFRGGGIRGAAMSSSFANGPPQPPRRLNDNPWARNDGPPSFRGPARMDEDSGRGFRADALEARMARSRSRSRSPPPIRRDSRSPPPLRRDSTPYRD